MKAFRLLLIFGLFASFYSGAFALDTNGNTVGVLITSSDVYDGYTLFAPIQSTTTYLIDNSGNVIHSWANSISPGLSVYLLENGNILRTASATNSTFKAGGAGGMVQEIESDGSIAWQYTYSGSEYLLHHDIHYMENGNILMIAWEYKSQAEATAAGRNPNLLRDGELWPDSIIEVQPSGTSGGTIVWQWHVWDHLIQDYDATKQNYGTVADHPELIDLNYASRGGGEDWNHFNSIDYNQELDQILVSVHEFGEIWVIDHSTTTAEAAGHTQGTHRKGGDLLYRWGNPQTYDAGTSSDQKLFGQHDATWIASSLPGAGHILVFNNGTGRPEGNYSSIEEIEPPVDANGDYSLTAGQAYGPSSAIWTYTDTVPTDFYSQNISGAQRMPNGNTLICNGTNGILFEVDSSNQTVWEYVNPYAKDGTVSQGDDIPEMNGNKTNQIFKVRKYDLGFSGLADYVTLSTGALQVTLSPQQAIDSGASWQVDDGNWLTSGATVSGLSAGSHVVHFSTVDGYTTPANQTVAIINGQTGNLSASYSTQSTSDDTSDSGGSDDSNSSNNADNSGSSDSGGSGGCFIDSFFGE